MSGMCTQHLGWKVPAAMLLISSFAWAQAPGSPTRASRGGVEAPSSPPLEAVRSAVRQYRQQHEVEIVRGYAELLSLPNATRSESRRFSRGAGFRRNCSRSPEARRWSMENCLRLAPGTRSCGTRIMTASLWIRRSGRAVPGRLLYATA